MDEGAQPSDTELSHISTMVRESMEAGAAGFSTSRFLMHKVPDGRCTPGTWADLRETKAIQEAIIAGGGAGAIFQSANDMATRFETELEMFQDAMNLGCQVLFSGGTGARGDGGVGHWRRFLEDGNKDGKRIASICHTRPSGAFSGLAQLSPFTKKSKAWRDLMALPTIQDRVAAMKKPEVRAALISEGAKRRAISSSLRPCFIPLGQPSAPTSTSTERGASPNSLRRKGRTRSRSMWTGSSPRKGESTSTSGCSAETSRTSGNTAAAPVVPMLGDAGAHVGFFTDTDSPTVLLSDLTRDRGVYTLEEAIHRITGKSAEIIGLKERGLLKEGWHADINVIDYANLGTRHAEYVNDFPHGGERFVVKSTGYDATLVAGEVVVRNCEHTGHRPGQVLREFQRG